MRSGTCVFTFTLALALAAPAGAEPPRPGSKEAARQLLLEKLRRDIAKVARSTEVTKDLIGRSRGAPFLPEIHLRLAELYVEQARYELLLVRESRGEGGQGSVVAPTAKLLKEKAVETYLRLLSEFPDFAKADRVRFYLAHEYRDLGRFEEMARAYEALIAKHPASPLVPDAHLVLGDHRFDAKDLAGARRHYQKVIDGPPSAALAMAHFKQAWVYMNEVNYAEALRHFEAVLKAPAPGEASLREQARRIDLQREALLDLAYAYTEVRKPAGALAYFRALAPTRNVYAQALEKLGRRYFLKQDFVAAGSVYRELARLTSDPEGNLEHTARIYEAEKRVERYAKVNEDVGALLATLDSHRFDWRVPEPDRKSAESDFEQYARDLATRAQEKAQGKNPALSSRAADAYLRYLESFPESPMAKEILANLADTLYEARRFVEAGDRYRALAEVVKDDAKAHEEALYNACAAFHAALKEAPKLPRFDRVWAQQGLIESGVAYVAAYPRSERVAEIELNIGRSAYEAGDFDRAVAVFEELVAARPNHASAPVAVELILDSYAQRQDFVGLAAKARALAGRVSDSALKQRLEQVAKQAEERQIGEVLLTAAGDKSDATSAGEQLRAYWEKNKSSPVAEKTLYAAFVQHKEARNYDQLFETGDQFIGAYPESPYLGDVFGTLASFATQTGGYDRATVYLEELYKRFPKEAAAQRLLAQSATLKALIGDHRGAAAAYRALIAAGAERAQRLEYQAKLLEALEALGDMEALGAAAAEVLRSEPQHVKAHLMAGLAAQRAGRHEAALTAYRAAMSAAGKSPPEAAREDAARAAFGASDALFRLFERVAGDGDVQAATAAKADLLGDLEEATSQAIAYNRGTWAVGALHRTGLAYSQLAAFLESAPAPSGLSKAELAQYQTLVAQQVTAIRTKGRELFEACLERSRSLEIYVGPVLGCLARGPEPGVPPVRLQASAPGAQRRAELEAALAKNPRDKDALAELADLFNAAGEPAKAKLTASRGLELDDRDARFWNKLGLAELLLGKPQEAHGAFARATKLGHPYAALNEAALRLGFGDEAGAKKVLAEADIDEAPKGALDLHPGAADALAKLKR